MSTPSFELREFFHLTFLRHISPRIADRAYAVKGGICLRFFHRSPRLSEDMDLDIASKMRLDTLQNVVDGVLESRAFRSSLASKEIIALSVSKPKQTETTQRWKVQLVLNPGNVLHTKIEFSRRESAITAAVGAPAPELLSRYQAFPFASKFYDASQMTIQKLLALSSPARNALRDLFDLHHLFVTLNTQTTDFASALEKPQLQNAFDKITGFSFHDFEEQVLPYLTPETYDLYGNQAAFDGMKSHVQERLLTRF